MSAPLLVADSGPLIALARIDLLSIPARIFRETVGRFIPTLVGNTSARSATTARSHEPLSSAFS